MDYNTFRKLSEDYKTVPVYKRILADLLTPISVYMRLAKESDYSFVLESAEQGEGCDSKNLTTLRRGKPTCSGAANSPTEGFRVTRRVPGQPVSLVATAPAIPRRAAASSRIFSGTPRSPSRRTRIPISPVSYSGMQLTASGRDSGAVAARPQRGHNRERRASRRPLLGRTTLAGSRQRRVSSRWAGRTRSTFRGSC